MSTCLSNEIAELSSRLQLKSKLILVVDSSIVHVVDVEEDFDGSDNDILVDFNMVARCLVLCVVKGKV